MTPEGAPQSPELRKSGKRPIPGGTPEGEAEDQSAAADESAHRELMCMPGHEVTSSLPQAAPSAPGEVEPPPPTQGAKSTSAQDATASSAQEAKSRSSLDTKSTPRSSAQEDGKSADAEESQSRPPEDKQPKSPPKSVSGAKLSMQSRLPALDDDADIAQQKQQVVARDGKADLGFTGTLLASAASSAPKGRWQEYRVYATASGKHVFSRVTRTIFAEENDKHEAEVFDPSPASMSSQLLRSAREIARSRPLTWMDAAVAFFGYDPLAKVLYRKLSVEFEEQI
jgi:hypothetical protein